MAPIQFKSEGAMGILGPSNKKVRGPGPPAPRFRRLCFQDSGR